MFSSQGITKIDTPGKQHNIDTFIPHSGKTDKYIPLCLRIEATLNDFSVDTVIDIGVYGALLNLSTASKKHFTELAYAPGNA